MKIISKAFRKVNQYFLAEDVEEIHITDYIWFYGQYVVIAGIVLNTVL